MSTAMDLVSNNSSTSKTMRKNRLISTKKKYIDHFHPKPIPIPKTEAEQKEEEEDAKFYEGTKDFRA